MKHIHPSQPSHPDPNFVSPYDAVRQNAYGDWRTQYDMLFDDIESGKFGEEAKKGRWYQHIKTIKSQHPK